MTFDNAAADARYVTSTGRINAVGKQDNGVLIIFGASCHTFVLTAAELARAGVVHPADFIGQEITTYLDPDRDYTVQRVDIEGIVIDRSAKPAMG